MIDQMIRTATVTVVLGVLMSGLCGCDAETASGTTHNPRPPVPETAPVPDTAPDNGLTRLPPPGHVRVTGMVFSANDDGMIPDRPFEQGAVVAIPLDRFKAVQNALKHDLVVGKYLQKSLAVPRTLLDEDDVDAGDLGADGTYALALRPGTYAFCLVELGGRRPQGTPAGSFWIERWIEVTVTTDEIQTVLPVFNRTTGEITVLY
ncbi:MAG: hypothetical protein ACYS0G_15575 [Planctomycetota bacterium]|jgi:hypothetical protein